MGAKENIAATLRMYDAASTGDLDTFDDLMIPNFITHGDVMFPFVRGRDILRTAIATFRVAFPDAKLTPEVIFADGDRVVAHVEVTGTHEGSWLGAEPTHKKMTWTASTIIRFDEDGMMAERWVIEDELGVMEQLGVAPLVGAAAASNRAE
jgi:predicted ester cyclase